MESPNAYHPRRIPDEGRLDAELTPEEYLPE
jgi:hypothetical protein